MSTSWDDQYKAHWEKRYSEENFAYGKAPNSFFKQQLDKLNPGHILMPAGGEGRNGVYAATKGWKVTAFDLSKSGKEKALQLANSQQTTIEYLVADLEELEFPPESFDAIALIYAHFSPAKKQAFHQKLLRFLKPGGHLILEAFSKDHLEYRTQNPAVGGPQSLEMLYSLEELKTDFEQVEFHYAKEEVIELSEGEYHKGKGAVVRLVGVKN